MRVFRLVQSDLAPLLAVTALLSVGGCQWAALTSPENQVVNEVDSRFPGNSNDLSAVVSIDDGISEDEAAALAIANNSAYQELLTELGVSAAQLFDAGLIADPQLTILLPLGPKQLEFTTFQAVDFLWVQPVRERAAELDVDRVAQSMVQNALDVIRDARTAHANLVLGTRRAKVASEAAELRQAIASLAQKRLAAGDISELEATTSLVDAMQAKADADRIAHDVTLARERLRVVMGLAMSNELIAVTTSEELPVVDRSVEDLVAEALVWRPDLRAAEIGIEAACERVGLAQNQFMNFDAIYDANGFGQRGSYESGPGARLTLPLFNRNQGGIAIADAQWKQASRRYVTVRDRVVLEVRTAYTQLQQALENLTAIRERILPELKSAVELARQNYENGGAPYFLVLQTTGQYLDTRSRDLQLAADVSRAMAELERAVGRRLVATAAALHPPKLPPAPATDDAIDNDGTDNQKIDGRNANDAAVAPPGKFVNPSAFEAIISVPADISKQRPRALRASAVRILESSSTESKPRVDRVELESNPQREPQTAAKRRNERARRNRQRDQDAKHVELTIHLQLDPRFESSGLRVSEVRSQEDRTGKDRAAN